MENTPLSTGGTGTGSAPGVLVPSDWGKWAKAAAYLIASSAIVGMLNGVLQFLGTVDFAHLVFHFPLGIEVSGTQVGMAATNLVLYLIELIAKDSRK